METSENVVGFIAASAFYPTYEEWKLSFFAFSSSSLFCLFILPMRNGNCAFFTPWKFSVICLFILPMRNGNRVSRCIYLFCKTLFILPMRNGNYVVFRMPTSSCSLFILPMRNGNETFGFFDQH